VASKIDLSLLADPAVIDEARRHMTEDERTEFDRLIGNDSALWRAQVGRQQEALDSEAFVTGYGGAAGGGKTDLIAGAALTMHHRTCVFRREKAQTEGVVQRITEILGTTDGYSSQKGAWRINERLIEFAGLDNLWDHQKWQGRAHDLKAYDEVTEQREHQVRFTMGWTRTSRKNQRARVLMTFNPPTTAEGRWVIAYFAPWLDDKYHRPAKQGELRWFTTIKGKEIEVETEAPFVIFKGEPLYDFDPDDFNAERIITPRSRTFISSRVTDNYVYVKQGYIQTLQGMPEPLRSQLLHGDFKAGVQDDEWQVIPTVWIDAAMDRWKARDLGEKGEMDSMGVDVAVGGRDEFIVSRRHGAWFDELLIKPGHEITQATAGPDTAAFVISHRRDQAPVHVDVVGWGLTTANFLTEQRVQVIACNGANKSMEWSRDGRFRFSNFRAEMVWRMREALDPEGDAPAMLPPDPMLRADLAAYKWTPTKGGILIRSKDEMKEELGRSPDKGDAVCLANLLTLKVEDVEEMNRDRNGYDRYRELE
jgi:phage terminase large subunit-like protein